MAGVYAQFYDILIHIYGYAQGQPAKINQWIYWVSWWFVTLIIVLVFVLFIFGLWLILKSLIKSKKKKNEVHYYYHRDIE